MVLALFVEFLMARAYAALAKRTQTNIE